MKRLFLGVAAALMLGAPAFADGLPSRGHVRGDDNDRVNWRGFYVGGHAGLAVGNTQGEVDLSHSSHPFVLATDYEVSGALYGVQAGWLGQWGHMVAGIEASYSGSNVQGSDAGCAVLILGADCRREVNWMATVTGRAGVAYDRALIYGLAGVAWAEVDTSVSNILITALGGPRLTGGETHVGWIVGFGLEWAFSDRVSARIEYAHIDLGDETHRLSVGGHSFVDDRVSLEMDTVRLGINVKLGGR
jgi:outer membrane immunogenic protein